MEITSLHFFMFVLGILIVYHLLPHRAQNYWLLAASYVFYITWSWKFALLLLAATVFHFELARHLRKEGRGSPSLLWVGVGANLLLFLTFKASSFYISRLDTLLNQIGVQAGTGALQIIVPLGLSYYVLQNISYLVDVYRGQMTPSGNWVDFALYLAYFPKMVAGPIERARTFLPMLARPRRVENQTLTRSLALIVVGLARKVLIADLLFAQLPWDSMTGETGLFSKAELVGWLVVYAFALYNDFAGYTGIVRGVSGLFGIELSLNFNTPFFAKSFTEFWNRWHITLSHWLRDYVFYPVNRMMARRFENRNGWQTLVIPPLVTMLASGFWHGPNWQMLVWGALHGTYLVVERVWVQKQPASLRDKNIPWGGLISGAVVFFLVALAWVPFMMRLNFAGDVFKQLLVGQAFGIRDYHLAYSLIVLSPALLFDYVQYKKADELFFLQFNPVLKGAMLATVVALLLIMSAPGTGQPFIYQGF